MPCPASGSKRFEPQLCAPPAAQDALPPLPALLPPAACRVAPPSASESRGGGGLRQGRFEFDGFDSLELERAIGDLLACDRRELQLERLLHCLLLLH